MRQGIWTALFFALLMGWLPGALAQARVSPAGQTPAQLVQHFSLPDTAGQEHTREEWKQARAVVLFFISAECPISNRYAPEINRLVADFARARVAFYAVHSDPALSAPAARQHATEFGYQLTVLLDPAQLLASQTGVELTPTAVVLSPQGSVLYRGRIDNRYLKVGQYRDTDIKPDLRLALEAILDGKPLAEPVTQSIGCFLPPPAKERKEDEPSRD